MIFDRKEAVVMVVLVLFAVCTLFLMAQNNGTLGWVPINIGQKDNTIQYLQEMAALENQHVAEIPDVFKNLFGNARVNSMILLNSYEVIKVNAVIEDSLVKDVASGELSDPTVNVFITEKTIRGIAEADDPANASLEALGSGQIKYNFVNATMTQQAVTGAVSWGTRIKHLFTDIF